MTAHCSRVLSTPPRVAHTSCLKTPPAFRVVPKHVEARARGREHDGLPGRRQRERRAHRRNHVRRVVHGHASVQRGMNQQPRLADRHDLGLPALERRVRSPKLPPLKRPPRITHLAGIEALNRAQRRVDVGGLGVVDEADAVNLGDRLQRVLEPLEALDRAASSPPARCRPATRPPTPRARRPGDAGPAASPTSSGTSISSPACERRTMASPTITTPSVDVALHREHQPPRCARSAQSRATRRRPR